MLLPVINPKRLVMFNSIVCRQMKGKLTGETDR